MDEQKKSVKSVESVERRKTKFGRAIIFCVSNFLLTIEGSTFSGQVSAIEARDAAIFTRIKDIFRAFSTQLVGTRITEVIPPPVVWTAFQA